MNQLYKGGDKAAYYVLAPQLRFVQVLYDGSIRLTSCPHDAALFTSKSLAGKVAKQVGGAAINSRTSQPNVIVGDRSVDRFTIR